MSKSKRSSRAGSRTRAKDSSGPTVRLQSRFLPILARSPARLALWLPLYRTPSPNSIYGAHWKVAMRCRQEAQEALLMAQISPKSGDHSPDMSPLTS